MMIIISRRKDEGTEVNERTVNELKTESEPKEQRDESSRLLILQHIICVFRFPTDYYVQ
jgi:hypothetical protein